MKIKASSKYRALVDYGDIEAGDEVTVTGVGEDANDILEDGVDYVWTARPRTTEGDTPPITAIPMNVFIHCFEEIER